MIMATLALAAALIGEPTVKWTAPHIYIKGVEFPVKVELAASTADQLPVWMAEAGGFSVNGKPLGKRATGMLQLAAGAKLSLEFDLGPLLDEAAGGKAFKLGFGDGKAGADIDVTLMEAAPANLDFMKMEPAQLAGYQVLMTTNRGTMRFEMWPDVAPNHVRNFLDLCYTKFYDGSKFHRVIPGFMIQGGDKTRGDGTGNGPRTLQAEFSDRKHVPGVLSMARQGTPNTPGPEDPLRNTASCQFFVMHANSPALDGNYSAFGKCVEGLEVVDKIVNTKRTQGDRPVEPQTIERALVVRAPEKK
jgi:peptidyl-prolyl cis-trans isomerase B (cyclophilin B)